MTITVHLQDESHTKTINNDGKPVLEYQEVYLMEDNTNSTVNIHQAGVNFTSTTGIECGSNYANYNAALARPMSLKKHQTRPPCQKWNVTVNYTTDCPVIDDPDPSHRRWLRSSSISAQQRYVFRDKNNKLIVDAAGSPFDGGIPVDVELTTITWKHNVDWASYDIGTQGKLSGSLNSDTFAGCDPYTLKLAYSFNEEHEGQYHYAAETYSITYDPLGWKPKPANAGLFYLNSGVRTRIKDAAGKDVGEPEPLTLAGAVVPVASRPSLCTFVTVEYHNTLSFSSIGLPLT